MKIALFQAFNIATPLQITQFLNIKDCLSFPVDTDYHYWYQDTEGNTYSYYHFTN